MSELINNREERQKIMKQLIMELHQGASVEDVKDRFREIIQDIGGTEIGQMEQALIREGLDPNEIKRMCDVHTAVFMESLDEQPKPETVPGHPVHTFKLENREIEKVLNEKVRPSLKTVNEFVGQNNPEEIQKSLLSLWEGLNLLTDINKHYSRKENILFSILEKYDITGPSTVMWGIQDDIRAMLKEAIQLTRTVLTETNTAETEPAKVPDVNAISQKVNELSQKVNKLSEAIDSMIYKEENIMFPMALELLSQDEWGQVKDQSPEIGYCLIEPEMKWNPVKGEENAEKEKQVSTMPGGYLRFDSGILTLEEISSIFNHLPFDITFVDKDDVVKYFSQGKERIFIRSKAIIGRKVQNCHPPASVHVIENILSDFKEGKSDVSDFWIQMQGKFVYIRYFAVRDRDGAYLGTLEVTQNIADIKAIEGEKRLR